MRMQPVPEACHDSTAQSKSKILLPVVPEVNQAP